MDIQEIYWIKTRLATSYRKWLLLSLPDKLRSLGGAQGANTLSGRPIYPPNEPLSTKTNCPLYRVWHFRAYTGLLRVGDEEGSAAVLLIYPHAQPSPGSNKINGGGFFHCRRKGGVCFLGVNEKISEFNFFPQKTVINQCHRWISSSHV